MENSKRERPLPRFCFSPFLTLEFVSDFEIRISDFSAAEPQPSWEGEAPAEPWNSLAARSQGSTGVSPSQEICAVRDECVHHRQLEDARPRHGVTPRSFGKISRPAPSFCRTRVVLRGFGGVTLPALRANRVRGADGEIAGQSVAGKAVLPHPRLMRDRWGREVMRA